MTEAEKILNRQIKENKTQHLIGLFTPTYYTCLKAVNQALNIPVVTKRFNDLTDALGYLNRGGHYFEERNTLEDKTIIAIANDIYYNKNGTHQAG